MRREVRELIEQRKQELNMAETNFSKAEMLDIMRTMIGEMKKPNVIEEKKFKEELEKDRRKNLLMVELGRAEEQARFNRENSCTHCREKDTGNSCARGTGVWTTQGQVHGDDTITLVCMRCASTWRWRASAQERDYAQNSEHGLLGFAPPPPDRCLKPCQHCGKTFENKELKDHTENCQLKPVAV